MRIFSPPRPISQHLFRKIVSQPGDENRNHLRRCVLYEFSDPRLRRQERIRIRSFVARAFRVKANDVARARSGRARSRSRNENLSKARFSMSRFFARRKKRRIHRPPTHHQIYKHSQRLNRKKICRAPERKVACATMCCEKAPSKPHTYRKTIDDWRLIESADRVKRPRCSRDRRRASGCKWKDESSPRQRFSGTRSKSVSSFPGSCGGPDERQNVRTRLELRILRVRF